MFSARRKPKKITSTESREDEPNTTEEPNNENGPVVRRPATAPKQKSKLRISFDPGAAAEDNDGSPAPTRAASSARLGALALSRTPKAEIDQDVDRPSYSKSYLDELKGSTPTTPKDLSQYNSSAEDELSIIQPQTQALDIASKFGSSALKPSAIPSAAEIAEKKERRNRLAKEEQASALTASARGTGSVRNQDDFISLDAYDSDGEFKPSRMQVSSYLRDDRIADASEHTRLVPEDEDVAEGFDDFVEDNTATSRNRNRINMGMKSDPVRERANIKNLIDHAEGGSGSDSDGSESENSDASAEHAYMTSQTRHGAGFSYLSKDERRRQEKEAVRPKQPEKTTPVPTLAEGLARLKELKESTDMNRQRAELRKVEIERRLREVESEKIRIQSALEDLGTQLEESSKKVAEEGRNGDAMIVDRGLEGLGTQGDSTHFANTLKGDGSR